MRKFAYSFLKPAVIAVLVSMCVFQGCSKVEPEVELPSLLTVFVKKTIGVDGSETPVRSKNNLIMKVVIPEGKHIFSTGNQTLGQPTTLVLSDACGSSVDFQAQWPATKKVSNALLKQDYEIFEGTLEVPVTASITAAKCSPIYIQLDYVLCGESCIPGRTRAKFEEN